VIEFKDTMKTEVNSQRERTLRVHYFLSKPDTYKLELKLKAMKNSQKAIKYLQKPVQSILTKSGGS